MIIPEDLNKAFKVYITERSGLYFKDHNLADLQTAIQERMKSKRVDSVPAYYTLLTISDNREDETRELINLLTIKHTYFFRNEPHFKALKENILPGIVERRAVPGEESDLGKPAIRIWSAGCSTGAEPYSIAMLLREIIPNMDDWDIQIIATDASTNALDTARRGRYRDTYLKNVDSEYLKKYFTLKSERGGHREYEVNDDIKGLVSFANHNLMEDQYPMNFDIILCRNVVIYFELKTTISVMDKICTSLNDDGYLFVGYSESLNYLSDKFKMESIGDAIVYRKSMVTAAPNISSVQSTETNLQMILEDVSKKEVEAKMEVEFQKISTFEKSYEELLVQATTCFHLKEYDKALVFIEEALSIDRTAADPHYLAAEVYMNQGEFDEDEIGEGVSINAFEKKTLARVKKDGYSCFHVKVNLDEECVLKSVRAFMVFRKLHEIGEVIKSYPNSEMIENEKFDLQFSCIFITREGSLLVKKKAMEVLEVSDVTIDDIPVDELWDKEGEQKAIAPIQEIEGAAPAHIEQLRKIRSVRVDIEQLDKMMNLVEELAINKLRLMDVGSRFPDADLKIIIEGLSRITDNLQTEVMEARLVPVAQIFDRFPRLVRDLARKQDKQIRIDIIGGDIELDRTVLDEIGDPLIHLIRNAVDHGVGTVEKRKALGKSVEGRIMLSAVREKGHILISVADDGDGMDIERIKNVALKRGVVSNDELASMNDEDIKMLVTRPGFSTREEVTDVSGRGVGLDVVREKTEVLGGAIQVESERDKGTKITMRLPITTAVVQALLVDIDSKLFAIPISSVIEIIVVDPHDVKRVEMQETILHRDAVLPIVRLKDMFGELGGKSLDGNRKSKISITAQSQESKMNVVILEYGYKQYGTVVDKLVSQQDIVIKQLTKDLKGIRGFAGATILGDGSVALVLDVATLI